MLESIPWREIAEAVLAIVAVLSRIQLGRARAVNGRKPRA